METRKGRGGDSCVRSSVPRCTSMLLAIVKPSMVTVGEPSSSTSIVGASPAPSVPVVVNDGSSSSVLVRASPMSTTRLARVVLSKRSGASC